MKKKLNILTLLACVLAITACGGKDDPTTTVTPTTGPSVTSTTPTTEEPTTPGSTTVDPTTTVTPPTTTVAPPTTTVTPPPSVDNTVHVTSINIVEDYLVLETGTTASLSVEVLPENADDKSFTFSVGDSSIASISETGEVLAIAEGSTFITATTTDGGLTDSINVSVYHRYNITASVDSGITVNVQEKAKEGDLVTVSLAYDAEAIVVNGVYANEIALGTSGSDYYFYMPAEDVEITVSSESVKHYHNVINASKDAVSLDTVGAYEAGDEVEIPFTILPGYQFTGSVVVYKNVDAFDPADKLIVDSTAVDGIIRFTMPAEKVEIVVGVEASIFTLTKEDAYSHISTIYSNNSTVRSDNGLYDIKFGSTVEISFVSESSAYCAKAKPVGIYIPEMDLTVPADGTKATFVMPYYNVTVKVLTENVYRNITLVGSEHLTLSLFNLVDGNYVALSETKAIYEDMVYIKVTSSDANVYQLRNISAKYKSEGSSYESKLTLTLEDDGYYSFEMPKTDLSSSVTITVTEKDISKFVGADFLGSYLSINSYNDRSSTSFHSYTKPTIDTSGIIVTGYSNDEQIITSYDPATNLLTFTNNDGKDGVGYYKDNLMVANDSFAGTDLITDDMYFLFKKQDANDANSLYTVSAIEISKTYHIGQVWRDGALYLSFVADVATQEIYLNPTFTFTSGNKVTDSTASYVISVDGINKYIVTNKTTILAYDGLQGTYSLDTNTLVLDGMGGATLNDVALSYIVNDDGTIDLVEASETSIQKTNITLGDGTYVVNGVVSEDLAPVYGHKFWSLTSYSYNIHIAFTGATSCVIYVEYELNTTDIPTSAYYGFDGAASYIYDSTTSTITITSTGGTATLEITGEAGDYTLIVIDSTLSFSGGELESGSEMWEF